MTLRFVMMIARMSQNQERKWKNFLQPEKKRYKKFKTPSMQKMKGLASCHRSCFRSKVDRSGRGSQGPVRGGAAVCAPGSWASSLRLLSGSTQRPVCGVSAAGALTAFCSGPGQVGRRVAVHSQFRGAHVGHILLVLPACQSAHRPHVSTGGSDAPAEPAQWERFRMGPVECVSGGFFVTLECVLLRNSWHCVIIMILIRAGVNISKLQGKNYSILINLYYN